MSLELEGFRFYFQGPVSGPPHVYVEKGAGRARFWLRPVEVDYSSGMTRDDLRRARQLAEQNQDALLGAWQQRPGG